MSESPLEQKLGAVYVVLFQSSEVAKKRIAKSIKFVNQWIFITLIKAMDFVISTGLKIDPILKRAVGQFLSMSEADKRLFSLPDFLSFSKSDFRALPSNILIQRSAMKDGFACSGDSGGPIVVKHSGRFVLAAVVSSIPAAKLFSSWPPSCLCNCEGEPETHARVSAAIPWIDQVMKERNLSFTCKDNNKFGKKLNNNK